MKDTGRIEEQESFGAWFKWVFGTFFFRLLGINLVFLICCVPVVTIPSALCGMNAVIQRYYRKQLASATTSTFFSEFLASFTKRTATFWLVLVLPLIPVICLSGILPKAVWYSLAGLAVVAVLLVLSWFIPQLVMLNLSTKQALKNALLLTAIETKTNFLLILIHSVSLTVVIFGLPVTAFLLVIIPVLNVVLTTGITVPVMQKYLVLPEEAERE